MQNDNASRPDAPKIYCRAKRQAIRSPPNEIQVITCEPVQFCCARESKTTGIVCCNQIRGRRRRAPTQKENSVYGGVRGAGAEGTHESGHKLWRDRRYRRWINHTAAICKNQPSGIGDLSVHSVEISRINFCKAAGANAKTVETGWVQTLIVRVQVN